jgi:signal transduction histidine kinase
VVGAAGDLGEAIWQLTRGEPALISLLANACRDQRAPDLDGIVAALVQAFSNEPIDDPCRAYRRWEAQSRQALLVLSHTITAIETRPEWLAIVANLCLGEGAVADPGQGSPELCLALKREGNELTFANPLFERILKAHFTPIRIADSLVLQRRWPEAQRYYKLAHTKRLGVFQHNHYTQSELVHCAFENSSVVNGWEGVLEQARSIACCVLGVASAHFFVGVRASNGTPRPSTESVAGWNWDLAGRGGSGSKAVSNPLLFTSALNVEEPLTLAGSREVIVATSFDDGQRALVGWASSSGNPQSGPQQRAMQTLTRLAARALERAEDSASRAEQVERRARQLAATSRLPVSGPLAQLLDMVVQHLLDCFREAGFAHIMISVLNLPENVIQAVGASGDLVPLVRLTRRNMGTFADEPDDDVLVHAIKTGRRIDVEDCLDRRNRCDIYAIRSISPPLAQQVIVPLRTDAPALCWPDSEAFATLQLGRISLPLPTDQERKLARLVPYATGELERTLHSLKAITVSRLRDLQLDMMRRVSEQPPEKMDDALRGVLETILQHYRASAGSIRLRDPRFGYLSYRALVAPGRPPEFALNTYQVDRSSTAGAIVQTEKPLWHPDLSRPEGLAYRPEFPEILSNCGVPIWLGGHVEGALVLDANRKNAFSAGDLVNLQAVAWIVSSVISGGQALTRERLRSDLKRVLAPGSDWYQQLAQVVEITRQALQADHCSIFLRTETDTAYRLRATTFAGLRGEVDRAEYKVGQGRTGWPLEFRRPLRIPARCPPELQNLHYPGLRPEARHVEYEDPAPFLHRKPDMDVALLVVPVLGADEDECWGVIRCVARFSGQTFQNFSHQKEELLQTVAKELAAVVERRFLEFLRNRQDTETNLRRGAEVVAHKLKNPVTGLQARIVALRLLQLPTTEENSAFIKDLERIDYLAKRVNRIAGELYNLTRPLAPAFLLLNLPAFVTELAGRLAETGKYEFDLLPPSLDWPVLRADRELFAAVFEEIIANAKQAMPAGGKITIHYSGPYSAREGPVPKMRVPYVTVDVEDEGPGVAPGLKDRIFTMYETTRTEGTGLGLSIVRRYMEHMEGWVIEDREPTPGARFRLAFPVSDASSGGLPR